MKVKCQCSKHSIECKEDFAEHYCDNNRDHLFGYPTELRQVLLNLFSNAKDAILESSAIDSSVKKEINVSVSIKLNEYKITVFNYGNPIPDEILSNIFDPYFTTKEEGEGTGIGLYMSKLIIENSMDGKLTCQNEPDGVTFTIIFKF